MINVLSILNHIIKFLTDPKNTRMILFAVLVGLVLLLFRQCGKTQEAKAETQKAYQEVSRVKNNHAAISDSIKMYMLDNHTMRAEKQAYELTINELKEEYRDLLGKLELEKNKPPKVIIKTEYVIEEVITEVPVYVVTDSAGVNNIKFKDSLNHNEKNYRVITGKIPFTIDTTDSIPLLLPGKGTFGLELGMNLNLALIKDKETKKISIVVDTDYLGVNFTSIEGASILDNPLNKKALRSIRKNWSLGFQVGYGININGSSINTSPYVGLGLNYSPKFLQW